MGLFRAAAEERGERLLTKALQEVPVSERTARDADVDSVEPYAMPDILEVIGLDISAGFGAAAHKRSPAPYWLNALRVGRRYRRRPKGWPSQ